MRLPAQTAMIELYRQRAEEFRRAGWSGPPPRPARHLARPAALPNSTIEMTGEAGPAG